MFLYLNVLFGLLDRQYSCFFSNERFFFKTTSFTIRRNNTCTLLFIQQGEILPLQKKGFIGQKRIRVSDVSSLNMNV